jgi:hypothetical protein
MAGFSKTDHRANRLLAATNPDDYARLEPDLEIVNLPRGTVIYEVGETMRHTYFPHDAIVSLVAVMEDGATAEIGVFGCEGVLGSVSASISRARPRPRLGLCHHALVRRPDLRRASGAMSCRSPARRRA